MTPRAEGRTMAAADSRVRGGGGFELFGAILPDLGCHGNLGQNTHTHSQNLIQTEAGGGHALRLGMKQNEILLPPIRTSGHNRSFNKHLDSHNSCKNVMSFL